MSISTFGGLPSTIGESSSSLAVGQLVQALGGAGLIPLNGQVITASNYPALYAVISTSPKAVATSPMTFNSATGLLAASGQWSGTFFAPSNSYLAVMTGVATSTMAESSTDGLNWTAFPLPVSTTWYSITASSTTAVVAGMNGNIAYTTNGTSWSSLVLPGVTSGTTPAPTVMWTGTQFVFCDPTAMATFTSPNGITWTPQHIPGVGSNVANTSSATAKPYFIGGSSYIVPGALTYALSTNNGTTFATYSYPVTITGVGINMIAYNGSNLAMMVGQTSIATSPDGINWTPVTCPYTTATVINVYYVTGAFIVVSSAGAWYSTDNGSTWTLTNIPATGGGTAMCNMLAVSGNNNGTVIVSPVYGTSMAVVSTNSGTSFSIVNLPVVGNWSICQWNGSNFVVLGDQTPYCLQSPDGLNWTIVNSSVPTLPTATQLVWSATNGSTMVVTCGNNFARTGGATNTCLTSPDNGTTWNTATMPTTAVWGSVAAATAGNGGLFVAIPTYNTYTGKQTASANAYAYSSDGINWTANTLPGSAQWAGVGYSTGSNKFWAAAYGASTVTYYSATGTSGWTALTVTAQAHETVISTSGSVAVLSPTGSSFVWLQGTSSQNETLTGSYLGTAPNGVGPGSYNGANANTIFYSNGTTLVYQLYSNACTAFANPVPVLSTWSNNTKMVSNGSVACFATGQLTATWNSSTGMFTYKSVTGPTTVQQWLTPVWDGSMFVFTCNNASSHMTSPDGINFTFGAASNPFLTDVVTNGNGVLVGAIINTGIYYSTNHGANWTVVPFPSNDIPASYIAPGVINGNFVVLVGLAGTSSGAALLTSTTNGLTWTSRSPFLSSGGTGFNIMYGGNNVAYNGSTVCVANPGALRGMITSLTGGSTWQANTLPNANTVYGVSYSAAANEFIAWYNNSLTTAATMSVSTNGINWAPTTTTGFLGATAMMGNVMFLANNYSTTSSVSAYGYTNAPTTTSNNQIYTTAANCFSVVPHGNTTQVLILPQSGAVPTVMTKAYNDATGVALPNNTAALGSLPWFIKAQ